MYKQHDFQLVKKLWLFKDMKKLHDKFTVHNKIPTSFLETKENKNI
jgi:hypothetical protein